LKEKGTGQLPFSLREKGPGVEGRAASDCATAEERSRPPTVETKKQITKSVICLYL